MHTVQIYYLLAAVVTFLVVLAVLYFAATASKNAFGLFAVACFFALCGAFWVYRFIRARAAP
jgi:hypothetical protein